MPRIAWVLNLDAELELADPARYRRSPAMAAALAHHGARIPGLVRAGDRVVGANDPAGCAAGLAGRTWCPTPSALAELERAGAELPRVPGVEVLRAVLHREFSARLGGGLEGASWVSDGAELRARLAQAARGGPGSTLWVLKRGWGFAGRGQRRVDPRVPEPAFLAWADRALQEDRGGQLEPWLERLADFGLHGWLSADGALVRGAPTLTVNDSRGAWSSSRPAAPGELAAEELEQLEATREQAAHALVRAGYFGPFGLDAFRYRDPGGRVRFQPLSEVNARFSMGWAVGMGSQEPHRA